MNYEKAINIWDTITCRDSMTAGEMASHIPSIARLSDLLPTLDYDTLIDIYQEINSLSNDAIVEIPKVNDLLVVPKGQAPFICVGVTFIDGVSITGGSKDTIKITEVLRESYEVVFKKNNNLDAKNSTDKDWYYRYINIGTQRKIYG